MQLVTAYQNISSYSFLYTSRIVHNHASANDQEEGTKLSPHKEVQAVLSAKPVGKAQRNVFTQEDIDRSLILYTLSPQARQSASLLRDRIKLKVKVLKKSDSNKNSKDLNSPNIGTTTEDLADIVVAESDFKYLEIVYDPFRVDGNASEGQRVRILFKQE